MFKFQFAPWQSLLHCQCHFVPSRPHFFASYMFFVVMRMCVSTRKECALCVNFSSPTPTPPSTEKKENGNVRGKWDWNEAIKRKTDFSSFHIHHLCIYTYLQQREWEREREDRIERERESSQRFVRSDIWLEIFCDPFLCDIQNDVFVTIPNTHAMFSKIFALK